MIGAFDDAEFDTVSCRIPDAAQLIIVTDGCFEIRRPDGSMMTADDLHRFVQSAWRSPALLEDWFHHCQEALGNSSLDDDFTMLRVQF